MTEEAEEQRLAARQVTKVLADADVFFNYGRDPNGKPLWSVTFQVSGVAEGLVVNFGIEQSSLVVTHVEQISPDPQLQRALLKLNAGLPVVKVGIGDNDHLVVWTHVALRLLTVDLAKEVLAAMVNGVQQVWALTGKAAAPTMQ